LIAELKTIRWIEQETIIDVKARAKTRMLTNTSLIQGAARDSDR
jgi:hypothetical protein